MGLVIPSKGPIKGPLRLNNPSWVSQVRMQQAMRWPLALQTAPQVKADARTESLCNAEAILLLKIEILNDIIC